MPLKNIGTSKLPLSKVVAARLCHSTVQRRETPEFYESSCLIWLESDLPLSLLGWLLDSQSALPIGKRRVKLTRSESLKRFEQFMLYVLARVRQKKALSFLFGKIALFLSNTSRLPTLMVEYSSCSPLSPYRL